MPRPVLRRTLWTALIAAVLVLAIVAVLPFAASTRLVRDRIAQELGAWSGFRVELGGRPEIEVWPRLRAVLHDVSFSDWDRPQPPVLDAERVEIDMAALPALRGEIDFDRLRLVRPRLRVHPGGAYGYEPILPRGGRIVRAVNTARQAIQDNPQAPVVRLPAIKDLGTIAFVDGRILVNEDGDEQEIASGLNGVLEWPELARGGTLDVRGTWRGEPVELTLSSSRPLLHLAGGTTGLRAVLRSPPLNASFDGTAGLSNDAVVDGTVQISTGSVRRAASWLQLDLRSSMAPGALEFSGLLSGTAERMKFTNASLVLDGNAGIGGFDVAFGEPVPAISGTWAFDMLDLPTLIAAFSPLLPQASSGPLAPMPFIDRLRLDLRLSASTARAGPVNLNEIAVTAQVKPGLAVLDISDSGVFGGALQAGIRADRTPGAETVELRLLASGFDGGAAGDALGMQALLPAASGTLSLNLRGTGATWERVLETADGTFSAEFSGGTLRRFNLETFLERLKQGGFFAWDDVTDGTLAIDGAQVEATMEGGVARIASAAVVAPQRSLLLQGIVPYVGGLALSGSVLSGPPAGQPRGEPQNTSSSNGPAQTPLASFFVGGSWNAPFITSTTIRPPAP